MTATTTVRLIAGFVLVVLAVETALLYAATRRLSRLPRFATLAPNLAAGAALVAALGASTLPDPALPVAGFVLLGGAMHALDLARRVRGR